MRTLLGSPSLDFMYINASAPDAPPLSETTIGCFIRLFFWIAACIIRAIWSDAPPAPAATTISTGFVGSHARVGAQVNTTANAPAVLAKRFILESSSWRASRRFLVLARVVRSLQTGGQALSANAAFGDSTPRAISAR